MQKTIFASTVLALCLSLSACGGGGGGGDNSSSSNNANQSGNTNTNTSTGTNPLSIPSIPTTPALNNIVLYTATPSYGTYTATNDMTADTLGWLNNLRQNVGLSALTNQSGLDQSSFNHAKYLVDNQMLAPSHDEFPGNPDYTGTHFYDRINQVLPTNNLEGEVLITWNSSQKTSTSPVQNLFDAPWHRIIMLDDFVLAGAGVYSTPGSAAINAMNMDLANYSQVLPTNNLLVYPSPGQSGVNPSWYDNETPDPFATAPQYTRTSVGYPITIQAGFNDTLDITTFTITEVDNGANVPCLAVDHNTSGENANGAECTPYQPLKTNTAYTVNVTGKLNGTAYNVTWSFGTASTNVISKAANASNVSNNASFNISNTALLRK